MRKMSDPLTIEALLASLQEVTEGVYTLDTGQKIVVWKDRNGFNHANGMGVIDE